MFCKDQGTPQQWGGQAACRAVRDAGGLPRRNPGARCTPTSISHQYPWHRVLAAQLWLGSANSNPPCPKACPAQGPGARTGAVPSCASMCKSPSTPEASSLQTLRQINGCCCGVSRDGCGEPLCEAVPEQAQGFIAGGFYSLERLCRPRGEQDKENQLTHMTPFGAFSQNVGAASWSQVSSLLLSPDNLCSSRTLPHITQQISAPAHVLHVHQFLAYKRASPRKHLPFLPHRKQERGAQQGLLQPARRPGQCRNPEHMGEGPSPSDSCAASLCPTAHSTGDAADYISQRTVYC